MEEERIPNFYLENEKMSKNLLTEREVKNYPVVERLSKFEMPHQVPRRAAFWNIAAFGNDDIIIGLKIFGDKNI